MLPRGLAARPPSSAATPVVQVQLPPALPPWAGEPPTDPLGGAVGQPQATDYLTLKAVGMELRGQTLMQQTASKWAKAVAILREYALPIA
jgi:hypothetical protein